MIDEKPATRQGPASRFRDLPIRRKLFLVLAAAFGFAITVAAAAVLLYEHRTFRPRILAEAEGQAGMMAEILVPPILFDDSSTATTYLATLANWPELSEAAVFDTGWEGFAVYRRDGGGPPLHLPLAAGTVFQDRRLTHVASIVDQGRRIGYLALALDLPPLHARLPQYGIMFGVLALSLLAAAAMLNLGLQRGVIRPLTGLAATAREVSGRQDYSVRAAPGGRDEVGELTAAFNQMLEAIAQRERSLHESRQLLQSVIDNSSAVIFVKDLEGRYVLVNRSFETTFRLAPGAALGKTDSDLFPPERAAQFRATDTRALESDVPVETEEYADQADGRHAYVAVKCLLRDEAGRPYAVCGIATDITPIKAYEEQLRQSQKLEAIGRLSGGVAHDFNNLLTAINGYAAMALEHGGLPPGLQGPLQEILKAGNRAAGLTRQLLAYSRKQVLQSHAWDLNEIISDMEGMLRTLIGEDVVLATDLGGGLPRVQVDRTQMEQIVLNLAINARDAMPKGGRLSLETRVMEEERQAGNAPAPGRFVVLSVSDTGMGMTREVMDRIFEPFFTTKEVGQGTGLGLSVVHGIVSQSGGLINVFSEVGRGTTFRIFLPEARPDATPAGVSGVPAIASRRGSETILLVEDEELVRKFAHVALEDNGFHVLEATRADAALALAADHRGRLDLVVTDVVMPDMSGPDLAEALRKLHPSLPILFISGYAEGSMLKLGILGEGQAFLQKPFTSAELSLKVRQTLDRARAARKTA